MKRIVSVSLGASDRNHAVQVEILGQPFSVERIGTDGSKDKAIRLIRELDGQVAAFGMGGIDLYVWAGKKRLELRDAQPLARAAVKSPMVDGSGLKNTLERRVVEYLDREKVLPLRGMKALLVSAVDRFGMAESLEAAGCQMTYGDFAFILGLPFAVHSWQAVARLGAIIGPLAVRLPIEWLYPTGDKQKVNTPKHVHLFQRNELIAGDFHFIHRYMPPDMKGKVVLTNTVTSKDVEELRSKGVRMLITTTPELQGRSFGTNVMEAVLVALSGKAPHELTPRDYNQLLDQMGFRPRIEHLAAAPAG